MQQAPYYGFPPDTSQLEKSIRAGYEQLYEQGVLSTSLTPSVIYFGNRSYFPPQQGETTQAVKLKNVVWERLRQLAISAQELRRPYLDTVGAVPSEQAAATLELMIARLAELPARSGVPRVLEFIARIAITGNPGTGKSSLIYAVARELNLGKVLHWPITSRSTLQQALYQYDAIGLLQEAQLTKQEPPQIGNYIRLGALGTALLPAARPRALLIDEIDKSDVDLPNDLLNIFEEGEYEIPELVRLKDCKAEGALTTQRQVEVRPHDGQQTVMISDGHVRCYHFPFVVMTSNGDRDFPAPFLRRCLRLEMKQTDDDSKEIVSKHLGAQIIGQATPIIKEFLELNQKSDLATDQLLNAIFLVTRENGPSDDEERAALLKALLAELNATRQSS